MLSWIKNGPKTRSQGDQGYCNQNFMVSYKNLAFLKSAKGQPFVIFSGKSLATWDVFLSVFPTLSHSGKEFFKTLKAGGGE